MASSNPGSRPVAIELLESDHRKVEALFEEYEAQKESDEETRRAIAEQICNELTVHTRVEEEIFYPWLRENLDDTSLVDEAEVEHATAKDLIAQLEGSGSVDETYDARLKVLGEYVKHHVKEEENEIFQEVRGEKDALDELGQEMHARKAELMSEMGMTEGMDVGALAKKGGRGRAEQRSR